MGYLIIIIMMIIILIIIIIKFIYKTPIHRALGALQIEYNDIEIGLQINYIMVQTHSLS